MCSRLFLDSRQKKIVQKASGRYGNIFSWFLKSFDRTTAYDFLGGYCFLDQCCLPERTLLRVCAHFYMIIVWLSHKTVHVQVIYIFNQMLWYYFQSLFFCACRFVHISSKAAEFKESERRAILRAFVSFCE